MSSVENSRFNEEEKQQQQHQQHRWKERMNDEKKIHTT